MRIKGIVIRKINLSSDNNLVNIFTQDMGVISAIVPCNRGRNKGRLSALSVLSYCDFSLFENRSGYIVNDAEILNVFWNIKNDIKSLTISQYLCELCFALSCENDLSQDFFRLFLNSLFYISKGIKSPEFVKLIFEIRSSSLCGYMPDIVCCDKCGKYEDENMYFDLKSGKLFCENCAKECGDFCVSLSLGMVKALRHIVYSPIEKLFLFNLSEKALKILNELSEKYIVYHVQSDFKSLKFYNEVCL